MSEQCSKRKNCRLCNSEKLCQCFKLEPTPPANAFVKKEAAVCVSVLNSTT